MTTLDGKVAIVTGAASGIGMAASRHLIAAGARIVMVDRDAAALAQAAAPLGDSALPLALDVSAAGSAASYLSVAETAFGPVQLAILNAGTTGPIERIETMALDAFDTVMAVNVRSVWLGLAALLPALRRNGGGAIVATSSTAGLRGAARLAAYSASKHAVIGLVKSAALEGARDGVRVNAVCPGPIDTGMIAGIEAAFRPDDPAAARRGTAARVPLNRLGTVDDVAAMMLFLLSDQAAFTTGGAYSIDGGVMAGLSA
ncbi:MAG: SDR family NAD(P)-dependent oxidoreductase [Janthinobacterium lividum]